MKNRVIEEINWMIISCPVSIWHRKGRKLKMKRLGFSLEMILLRFDFAGSANEAMPRGKWFSEQFPSLCKSLPQARWEFEGDRRTWRRQKWTNTQKEWILAPGIGEDLSEKALEEGWVRYACKKGRVDIIPGGRNLEYKDLVMKNVLYIW